MLHFSQCEKENLVILMMRVRQIQKTLQYIMDTANRIIAHLDWYDTKVDFYGTDMYARFIYQMSSDLKYTAEAVISEES